jgi:uncharacterized repeat protein (TIGR01451 family)
LTAFALALFVLAQLVPDVAPAAPDMKGIVEVFVKDDAVEGGWRESATVHPGDTVKYRLVYTNDGTAPAVGFTLSNAIPAGTALLAKPTAQNCTLEFSFDGGSTYAPRPTRLVDGKRVEVPPAEYTHLRCKQGSAKIGPGERVATEYSVRVK